MDAYPSLILADGSGTAFYRNDGYLDKDDFNETILGLAKAFPHVIALERAIASGTHEEVQNAVERLRASLPKNAELLRSLAWDWAVKQDRFYRPSVVIAAEAVRLEPKDPNMLNALAHAELGARYLDEAITHFRRLTEEHYTSAAMHLAMALAARGQEGDDQEAVRVLREYHQHVFDGKVD